MSEACRRIIEAMPRPSASEVAAVSEACERIIEAMPRPSASEVAA